MRTAILAVWCMASTTPIPRLIVLALAVSLICAFFAMIRREPVAGKSLNSWDEASYYLLIAHGALIFA